MAAQIHGVNIVTLFEQPGGKRVLAINVKEQAVGTQSVTQQHRMATVRRVKPVIAIVADCQLPAICCSCKENPF